MTEYGHNRAGVLKYTEGLIGKFLRSRSDKTAMKLYHQIQNQYGYIMLSGDKELAGIIKDMFEQAKTIKNY